MREVAIPIFINGESQPCAMLRADWIHRDFQRKGFFRIGVLPLAAVEGLEFQIRSAAVASNSFSQLGASLRGFAHESTVLEFRNATVVIGGPRTNRIEFGVAHVYNDGRWELARGVNVAFGDHHIQADSAVLQTVGPKSGRLNLRSVNPLSMNLFSTGLSIQSAAATIP